jgi:hypothetical protein
MNSTIKYNTGRVYDTEQVLNICVESDVTDDFGLRDVVATFSDDSRHISGRVSVIVFSDGVGPAVLAAYDAGQYQSI